MRARALKPVPAGPQPPECQELSPHGKARRRPTRLPGKCSPEIAAMHTAASRLCSFVRSFRYGDLFDFNYRCVFSTGREKAEKHKRLLLFQLPPLNGWRFVGSAMIAV